MAMRPVAESFPMTQKFYDDLTAYNLGAGHGAIDFATPVGTPVVAPEDGIIRFADYSYNLPGGPNDWVARKYQIKPAHGVTNQGGGIMTFLENEIASTWVFAHLSDNNIAPAGTRVKKGQIIGYTGNTGSSTGPHLHVSLIPANPNWNNGYFGAIDPAPYLTEKFKILAATQNKTQTQTKTEVSTMGYPYKLHTQWTSPNKSTRAFFGHSGKPNSIVLHWWDKPENAGTFEGTVSWLCNPQSQVSAHYVVSGRNIACIVSPEEAAWHSGTAKFNGSSIGIEIDPKLPTGTMESVYQLCYELEQVYGSMLFYGHKDVNPGTACPGIIYNKIPEVINKVNALHKSGGKVATASTPSKQTSKPKPATAGPVWTATDNALVHDINGNKRTLRQVLGFRFDKYEKNIKATEALAKRVAELEKKVK